MKNKLIILLCLAIFAMAALASCDKFGGGKENECQHTLSEEWTTSETQHWHAPTCEHGEFRSEPEAHADADEDGLCDSCGYEVGHEHKYATEWSSNANVHWHAAICTHVDEHTPEELHSDEDNNGYCDVCNSHAHVLDPNGTGKCTICDEQIKEIDTSDIPTLIAAIVGNHNKVSGGNIIYLRTMRDDSTGAVNKHNTIIDYLIGNNSIYYKSASAAEVTGTDREGTVYQANTSSMLERWVNLESNGSIFGVYKETVDGVAGEFCEDPSVNENTLFGYYYSVSTFASGYGAEGILANIYEKSQSINAYNYVVEEGENGYKFSFEYAAVNSTKISSSAGTNSDFDPDVQVEAEDLGINHNVNYFVVSVEFAYDENYTLTKLDIKCDCYTNDAGANLAGDLDSSNVDLTYDAVTGVITLNPNAKADTYEFKVEQTAGEKTFVNEYTKDYFAPKGFLVYADEACTTPCPDTVTVSLSGADKYARFYLEDENGQKFTSSTAEALEWTTSDESGLSCQFAIGSAFSFATSHVKFLAKAVGTYTVTLTYQGVTRTFTVNVVA